MIVFCCSIVSGFISVFDVVEMMSELLLAWLELESRQLGTLIIKPSLVCSSSLLMKLLLLFVLLLWLKFLEAFFFFVILLVEAGLDDDTDVEVDEDDFCR